MVDLVTAIIIASILGPVIALGGHGTLAVLAIRKAHRDAKADYTAKIEESRQLVIQDVTRIIDAKFKVLEDRKPPTPEEIAKAVPPVPTPEEIAALFPEFPSIAAGLEEFLRSSAGGQWAGELAVIIAERAQAIAAKKLEGVVGGMLRTDEARLAEVLRNVRFGNPFLDGMWGIAMGDPQLVHLVAGRLAKAFHAAGGLTNVLGNERESQDTPELTDGNAGYV